MKVAKFGGSSLADAAQIKKVLEIVKSDPRRTCIVVSAPGKRSKGDHKITDLLYEWHRLNELGLHTNEVIDIIQGRFEQISHGLKLSLDIGFEFARIDAAVRKGNSVDYVASRGEYLCAKLMAEALDYEFVDAVDLIRLKDSGEYRKDDGTIFKRLAGRQVVIPGFYGSKSDGSVKTFSRGGSDLTGAIVARALSASLYENWTDVSGIAMAHPEVVTLPKPLKQVSYREMRELAYMGFDVLHEEAMLPVQEVGIPTNVRNTNDPSHPGTFIVSDLECGYSPHIITGIAGRKDFTSIKIDKTLMNKELGFAGRVLSILESFKINLEHMPSGVDTLSLIIETSEFKGNLDEVVEEIELQCRPDSVEVSQGIALIAIVGRGMVSHVGVMAKVASAVAGAGINLRMVSQGSSEISIIIGVGNEDYETAVRAIYQAFVP